MIITPNEFEKCSNCIYLKPIYKHPNNKTLGKGRGTDPMGFGCTVMNQITFLGNDDGFCELFNKK